MMITCDKDLAGQIYVCSEELEQNPNSQGAAILERSFSITKWPLRQCLVEYFCYTNHNPQPVKTRYEMTENVIENEIRDCPNHRDKIFILRRLKKIKCSSGLVKSLKSETDNGLSSCSNFQKDPY